MVIDICVLEVNGGSFENIRAVSSDIEFSCISWVLPESDGRE